MKGGGVSGKAEPRGVVRGMGKAEPVGVAWGGGDG